jgi:protein-tyrosine-phosphatase
MMRFSDTKQNALIVQALRAAMKEYGLHLLRADQKSYTDSLWANVRAYIDACKYGIAVFDQLNDKEINPNVSLEVGYMLALEKPILLLKEQRLQSLPTDLVGHLYRQFDGFDIEATIRLRIKEWLRDVGIAKSPAERLLVFVSYGGTCRCAMAKIATEQALAGRTLDFRLRVESVAHAYGSSNEASRGARRAVFEQYGRDLLESHRVLRQNPGILKDADLILVMEEKLKEGLPLAKTVTFNEFFGAGGDVPNPWPDDDDDAARERYLECMIYLRRQIETHKDDLLAHIAQFAP